MNPEQGTTVRLTFKQLLADWLVDLSLRVLFAISGTASRGIAALGWYRMRHLIFRPRPGDIYIATAPKTGTTWMQQIVYQLLTQGEGEFEHIYQVAPFFDHLASKPWGEQVLESLPSPRILKTHLNYGQVAPPPDSRVIYVTRNAADSLVSLHHHQSMRDGFRTQLGTSFLRGHPMVQQWFEHLETWWPHRNDANVLHVRYEDLAADLEGGIRKVARFLGIPIQEERMPAILEKCGFAYMKRHSDRFDVRLYLFQSGQSKMGFIRKGVVGDGKTALSPEVQAALGDRMVPLRKRLGIGETEI